MLISVSTGHTEGLLSESNDSCSETSLFTLQLFICVACNWFILWEWALSICLNVSIRPTYTYSSKGIDVVDAEATCDHVEQVLYYSQEYRKAEVAACKHTKLGPSIKGARPANNRKDEVADAEDSLTHSEYP